MYMQADAVLDSGITGSAWGDEPFGLEGTRARVLVIVPKQLAYCMSAAIRGH